MRFQWHVWIMLPVTPSNKPTKTTGKKETKFILEKPMKLFKISINKN